MQIQCPQCGKTLKVPAQFIGKVVKCPCGHTTRASSSSPGIPSSQNNRGTASPSRDGKASSGLSITSMILGILSIALCFGLLLGVPAIITGFLAKKKIKTGQATGRGFAITGIITGFLGSIVITGIQVVVGVGLLMPAAQAAKEASRRMDCSNNMKQIALAFHNYHSAYKQLPATATGGSPDKRLLSWRVALLPFLGEQELYEAFNHNEPWDSEHNLPLAQRMPEVYRCESATVLEQGKTVYLLPINALPRSADNPSFVFRNDAVTKFRDILDGLANTIMMVEAPPSEAVTWTQPEDLPVNLADPLKMIGGKVHIGGTHVMMADGAVIFITNSIDSDLLAALLTKQKGEVIEEVLNE